MLLELSLFEDLQVLLSLELILVMLYPHPMKNQIVFMCCLIVLELCLVPIECFFHYGAAFGVTILINPVVLIWFHILTVEDVFDATLPIEASQS